MLSSSASKFTLPNAPSQFKQKEYWDSIFGKLGTDAFEWYGSYSTLCSVLRKYVRPQDKILVVGCGNSQLSADMYDDGYFDIANIDISDVIIKKMNAKNAHKRPKMTWLTMDATQMVFDDASFNVIVDKGTVDALMPDNAHADCDTVDKMFRETERVLRVAGRFMIVTLLQGHILNFLLDWFGSEGWFVRIHTCEQSKTERSMFAYFVVVCTKLKKIPGMKSIFELCIGADTERIADRAALVSRIQELQHQALVRHYINTGVNLNEASVELWSPDLSRTEPRYRLHVVDREKACKYKFALFIVPQGRETEWLFATPDGRQHLADNSDVRRLAVVHLTRSHRYKDMQAVKEELESEIMELAPKDVNADVDDVPFLSLGQELGVRTIVCKAHSDFGGDYVVEDVEDEHKQIYRRLIFECSPNIIQSEAKIKKVTKKGKKKDVIDVNHLACEHHRFMVAGLGFLLPHKQELRARVLIFGLGGGSLPMYIYSNFPKLLIEVVDIDPEVLKLATSWFGFKQDERMKVHIRDGLDVIADFSKAGETFDYVLLDVDSKANSVGLSCPPEEFLGDKTLRETKSLLNPNGVCVINLVCRNPVLKESLLDTTLEGVFGKTFRYQVADELNTLVYCFPDRPTADDDDVRRGFEKVNKMCNVGTDVDAMMEQLKIQ